MARHAEATEVHVELEDRPDELVLIVRDNGKGIAESQVSQRFWTLVEASHPFVHTTHLNVKLP